VYKSETDEHKTLKETMYKAITKWLPGSTVKEYMSTGQKLDIFHISYGGIAIMVEAIWTETETHFSDDMIILLTSDAVIKVVVVNPKILQNSKLTLKYEKIRTSEF
jgi:hypothetical protein